MKVDTISKQVIKTAELKVTLENDEEIATFRNMLLIIENQFFPKIAQPDKQKAETQASKDPYAMLYSLTKLFKQTLDDNRH